MKPPRPAKKRLPVVYETSAGGIVVRQVRGRRCVALLKTRHTRGEVWVLPKGHIEHARGETGARAATREVKEELGISAVRLVRKIGTVRWQFAGTLDRRAGSTRTSAEPRAVLVNKTVHHYLFEGLNDRLRPQADEGFLEARWVPVEQALTLLTYPTDRSILKRVRRS